MEKVKWGILSTAKIGREKVIPAMQKCSNCEVVAIASPNKERREEVAELLSIPNKYNSYQELLDDDSINAVYIPLPNHLHVEWAIKAIKANKHVLCEKPISVTASELLKLIEVSSAYPHMKVMEAFMYHFHPQWQKVKSLLTAGGIGEIRTVQSFFSYYNIDPGNIRNQKEVSGGALMDIGCYCVSFARFLFEQEPEKLVSMIDYDPVFNTDRLTSALLQFPSGTSTFTCSTQLAPYQRVNILGTKGRIEVEIPVNAPPDKQTRIIVESNNESELITFDPVDQYTLQAEAFSESIINNTDVPFSLADSLNNMKVIDALFASGNENWVRL
jgi:predicted dehydrogenase